MYEYGAYLLRIVDGDTIDVLWDYGANQFGKTRLRVAGINAPEMSTEQGVQSRLWAVDWFNRHAADATIVFPPNRITIDTIRDRRDPYGRYIAQITAADGHVFNEDILADGQAVVYKS